MVEEPGMDARIIQAGHLSTTAMKRLLSIDNESYLCFMGKMIAASRYGLWYIGVYARGR
jgi:hypothetical protein